METGVLLAILLIVGILAMPIMLICSLGRLRRLREEVFELKVLLLNLQNQMRRIVLRTDAPGADPIETPKAEPVAGKTVVEKPVEEKNPVPERETQFPDSCNGGRAEARPSREDETCMESDRQGGPRFCAAEVLQGSQEQGSQEQGSQEKVSHAIPAFDERDEGDAAAYDLMDKFADWFCVRGAFAPKGVSREFAVATHWLVRVGLMLLVGSIIYFVNWVADKITRSLLQYSA